MLSTSAKIYFLFIIYNFRLIYVYGNPVYVFVSTKSDIASESSNNEKILGNMSDCKREEFNAKDIVFLDNDDIFLKSANITINASNYHQNGDKVYVCLNIHENKNKNELIVNCKDMFEYESDEFEILLNRSVLLYGDIIGPGEYELRGGKLRFCAVNYISDGKGTNDNKSPLEKASITIGQVGSAISIVSLFMHLLIFCLVPSLRNLPGYNLASLAVAFILGYSFFLIGQIREVVGLFCIISAILQQNFFLVAFFCMNVLAFDVWRRLKLATEKFIFDSNNVRKRQFMWYLLYSWGCPLIITILLVLLDNIDGVPYKIKPDFGINEYCLMRNDFTKTIFFIIPAFTLFFVNGIFFIMSYIMISNNTMKCTNDQQKQTFHLNYVLYFKLVLMIGLNWLIGVIAILSKNDIVWIIYDLFYSFQGLFLFLLFSCTKEVVKHLKKSTLMKNFSMTGEKYSMSTTKVESETSS